MKSHLFLSIAALSTACSGRLDIGQTDPISNPPPGMNPPDDSAAASAPCTPIGAAPKVIAQIKGFEPSALAPDGDTLWFGGRTVDDAPPGKGAILKVSVKGGDPERVVDRDYYAGAIGVIGNRLAYVQSKTNVAGSGWTFDYLNVLLRDKASGTIQKLDNPRTTTLVSGLVVHSTGVYWTSREYDATAPASISRWDPKTGKATELTTLRNASRIVMDTRDLFYTRWSDKTVTFEAVPIAGGAPRVLKTMPQSNTAHWTIAFVDADSVFYLKQSVSDVGTIGAGDLVAMAKDGSKERVIVSQRGFSAQISGSRDYFYFNDSKEQNSVFRVKKSGGAADKIHSESNRWVSSIATDACNVYWTVVNPPAVMGRSH